MSPCVSRTRPSGLATLASGRINTALMKLKMAVFADAECEREHGYGGETGVLQQLAEGEAEVLHWMNGWVDDWIIGSIEVDTINPFIHQSINPEASAPCSVLALFIAQCLHRIDLCGSPRWQPTGERGNGNHNGGIDGEEERIGGAHTKQHVFEHARYEPRCNQA